MKSSIREKWESEQHNKLKDLLETGKYTYSEIASFLGRSELGCRMRAWENGLKNKKQRRLYCCDDNFWKTPNLMNSYYAGFASADAHIRFKSNHYLFQLKLQYSDRHVLQIFLKNCDANYIVKDITIKSTGKTYSYIHITSDIWAKDLSTNFNVIPNKTFRLSPPNIIGDALLFSWLIGYIDGDGCIHFTKDNVPVISMSSCSYKVLEWIHGFIYRNFPQNKCGRVSKIYKSKDKNCYKIMFSGIKAACMIDYLRQYPVPRLVRKWDKPEVLEQIVQYKQDYPKDFIYDNLPPIPKLEDYADLHKFTEEKQNKQEDKQEIITNNFPISPLLCNAD